MKNLYKVQTGFKETKAKDISGNGISEYGNYNELAEWLNENREKYSSIFLSKYVRGYHYYYSLPDSEELKEKHWCFYAVPNLSRDGRMVFVINESGKIWKSRRENFYMVGEQKIPTLDDIYTDQPFTSAINQSKWELIDQVLTNKYE
ncbi:hypothetical protein ACFL5I_01100 [Planctomycetota bacterium]